jgi:hypothetical protein
VHRVPCVYMLFNTRNVQSGTFVPFWLAWRSGVELRRDINSNKCYVPCYIALAICKLRYTLYSYVVVRKSRKKRQTGDENAKACRGV